MQGYLARRPLLSAVILLAAAILLYLVFAVWPDWLEDALGRKKVFVNTLLNGLTLAALYFLVASGFTLVFGLMRNVNLAHGSLYPAGRRISATTVGEP